MKYGIKRFILVVFEFSPSCLTNKVYEEYLLLSSGIYDDNYQSSKSFG